MPHQQFQSCIDACHNCALACDHCAVACLDEKDVTMLARCIRLDLDCASICRLAASYMARGSELSGMICEACAEVCDLCAQECEKHSSMDHCRECAQACRRCAEECRRMASTQPQRTPAGRAARPPAH